MSRAIPIPPHAKALIFDLDGTVADTMPLHFRAWCRAADEYGLSFPEARFYAMAGVPTVTIIEALCAEQGKDLSAHEVAERKEQYFEELIGEVTRIASVAEVISRYAGKLPLAIATGGIRRLCDKTLSVLGLTSLFPVTVTADDVKRGKPHPDIFLEAAKRLGVSPQDCCVLEDADPGIQAAIAAGMDFVDVRRYL